MTILHPHWQATDDSDDDHDSHVHITVVPSKETHQSKKDHSRSPISNLRSPSRRPAAFVGIFLCMIAGAAAFQGFVLSDTKGQVSTGSTVEVHLRSTGADPVTITVQPGSTINWTNDDTIPHVLSSDTLPTAGGQPFMTSAIFPGSTSQYVIPATATPGAYAYISKTAQTVSGQIIVQGAGSVSTTLDNPFSVPGTTTQTSSVPAVTQTQTSSVATQPVDTSMNATVGDSLPVNPHTVGSGEVPLPSRQTGKTPSVSAHMPSGEPVTGPEVWVTIFLTITALLFVSRKAFRTL